MSSKGLLNAYDCKECKGVMVTVDLDDGVTPFQMTCEVTLACKGWMTSRGYVVDPDEVGEPTFEWYKPSPSEVKKSSDGMRDHAAQEGLFFRKRKKRCSSCKADAPLSPFQFGEVDTTRPGFKPGAYIAENKLTVDICDNCLVKAGYPPMHLKKVGRNEPCPCGGGKKYKKCHGVN